MYKLLMEYRRFEYLRENSPQANEPHGVEKLKAPLNQQMAKWLKALDSSQTIHNSFVQSFKSLSLGETQLELLAIKVPLIRPGDDLVSIFLEEIAKQGISIRDQDIIVISSKIVAMMQKRVVRLASIKPSHRAKTLSKELNLDSRLMELILKESNHVYGGIPKLLLTLKYNLITPNAGIDLKNAPMGFVALLPLKPFEVASSIKEEIFKRVGKNVGVIIVDSRINPLRMGTTGMAIGVAGFDPVVDYRGKKDLYNKPISFTRHSMADDLASAAHALMGEANERIPIAIVRDAPVKVKGKKVDPESMEISKEECLFSRAFRL